MVSARLADLHQLGTIYSVEDMHGLIDVISTDNHNRQQYEDLRQRQQQR